MNFAIAAAGSMPTAVVSAKTTTLATSSSTDAAQHRKMVDAAQQFEGMLLQEMLKPMKEHGFCQSDDDSGDKDDNSGFADTLTSFGTESVATAIAKGGGLGLSKKIVEQVEGEKIAHAAVVERAGSNAK
jgi:Rod binding domain-containing protein